MIEDYDFDINASSRADLLNRTEREARNYWGDVPFEITHITAEDAYGAYGARVYTRAVTSEAGITFNVPPHPDECPNIVMPPSGRMQILASNDKWFNIVINDALLEVTEELLLSETREIDIDRRQFVMAVGAHPLIRQIVDMSTAGATPKARRVAEIIYDAIIPDLLLEGDPE